MTSDVYLSCSPHLSDEENVHGGGRAAALPPEQVVEQSDQGRWFQEKPTSLSPLPVRWIGTLNLYLIPWFCSWRRTWGAKKKKKETVRTGKE